MSSSVDATELKSRYTAERLTEKIGQSDSTVNIKDGKQKKLESV